MQVGESEAGKFFGIALSLFPSPMQATLKEAAAAVLNVDLRVRRMVHRPSRLCRPSHHDFVDHSRAPTIETSRCQLSAIRKVSVFPRVSEVPTENRTGGVRAPSPAPVRLRCAESRPDRVETRSRDERRRQRFSSECFTCRLRLAEPSFHQLQLSRHFQ